MNIFFHYIGNCVIRSLFRSNKRRNKKMKTCKSCMTQLRKFLRVMENNNILGDWKSVVGDESFRNVVVSHGLCRRNYKG
jgi:hypothetical protein